MRRHLIRVLGSISIALGLVLFFVFNHSKALDVPDSIQIPADKIKEFMESGTGPVIIAVFTGLQNIDMVCFEFSVLDENLTIIVNEGREEYLAKDLLPSDRFKTFFCRQDNTPNVGAINIYKNTHGEFLIGGLMQIGENLYRGVGDYGTPGESGEFYLADPELLKQEYDDFFSEIDVEPADEESLIDKASQNFVVRSNTVRIIKLALETDYELWQVLTENLLIEEGGNIARFAHVVKVVSQLFASANVVLMRDFNVAIKIHGSFFIYSNPQDPWSDEDDQQALHREFKNYWLDPVHGRTNIERTFAYLLTGKEIINGFSSTGAYCNGLGYGLSRLDHSDFPAQHRAHLEGPLPVYALSIFLHEVGHLLGSEHSWNYEPRWECCARNSDGDPFEEGEEEACIRSLAGAEQEPTLMSYCRPRELRYHERVIGFNSRLIQIAVDNGCVEQIDNAPPMIQNALVSFRNVSIVDNQRRNFNYSVTIDAVDPPPGAGVLYYVWDRVENGERVLTTSIEPTINISVPSDREDYFLHVTVYDQWGLRGDRLIPINPQETNREVNTPPSCVILPNYGGDVAGEPTTIVAAISDPNLWQTVELQWNFGDQGRQFSQNIGFQRQWTRRIDRSYVYWLPGNYEIQLAVRDEVGATGICHLPVTIRDLSPEITNVVIPGQIRPGIPMTFLAAARDRAREPITFVWNFGDGYSQQIENVPFLQAQEGVSIQHTYYAAGAYQVQLHVMDPARQRSQLHTTNIFVPQVAPQIQRLTFNGIPLPGKQIQFIVFASDQNRDPLTYTWQFRGSVTRYTQVPFIYHIFNVEPLQVIVTVSDPARLSSTTTRTFTMNDLQEGMQMVQIPINIGIGSP